MYQSALNTHVFGEGKHQDRMLIKACAGHGPSRHRWVGGSRRPMPSAIGLINNKTQLTHGARNMLLSHEIIFRGTVDGPRGSCKTRLRDRPQLVVETRHRRNKHLVPALPCRAAEPC